MRFLTYSYPLKASTRYNSGELFVCAKHFKRLFIQNTVTGELCYTPPDHVKLHSREPMKILAEQSSLKGGIDIADVIELECRNRIKRRST